VSMTVDSMAQSYYNQYTFSTSQTATQNAVDSSTISKSDFNISNLTNALDALDTTENVNPYTTNLDQYVQSSFNESQLSQYSTLSSLASSTTSALNSSGSLDNTVSMAYMKNKLGLSSSSFNIYSVLSPTSTAELDSLSTSASSKTSSDSVSAYQNFLSDNPIGTFLNTSA